MMAKSRGSEFRILSLSGGGYLGLYAAQLLASIEDHVGEPLARRFDLVAGTSVGGILAVALAFEVPMRELCVLFREHGAEIFSHRALPTSSVGRLLDLTRAVMGPKYDGTALRKALQARIGERTLADALHAMVVPAVNVTRSHTKVFKTPHADASAGDEHYTAVDVAMAASAAPAYFPAIELDGELYADGGLFAVAPDQVAMHEAVHFMGARAERVRMLSVGTAIRGYQPAYGVNVDDGAVGWLSDGRLILTIVAVQQQHVVAMMQDRLGDRYLRLDADWPADAGLGIDVATGKSSDRLAELAQRTWQQARGPALDRYLFP
jgi:uncharacterized protein